MNYYIGSSKFWNKFVFSPLLIRLWYPFAMYVIFSSGYSSLIAQNIGRLESFFATYGNYLPAACVVSLHILIGMYILQLSLIQKGCYVHWLRRYAQTLGRIVYADCHFSYAHQVLIRLKLRLNKKSTDRAAQYRSAYQSCVIVLFD